jgi:hypothetical protein
VRVRSWGGRNVGVHGLGIEREKQRLATKEAMAICLGAGKRFMGSRLLLLCVGLASTISELVSAKLALRSRVRTPTSKALSYDILVLVSRSHQFCVIYLVTTIQGCACAFRSCPVILRRPERADLLEASHSALLVRLGEMFSLMPFFLAVVDLFLSRDTSLRVDIVEVRLYCSFRNIQFSVNFTGEPVVGNCSHTSANRANCRSWLTKYEATRECKTEIRVLTVFVTTNRHYSKSQFLNSKQEIFSSPMLKVALSLHE